MRNEDGVTLVTLMVTIILIIIIASIGIYTGIEAYKTMQIQNFSAQMRLVSERVNLICDDWKNWEDYDPSNPNNLNNYIENDLQVVEDGITYTPKRASASAQPEFNEILTDSEKTELTGEDKIITNYYYFSSEDLSRFLGLRDLKIEVIINFSTRNFVEKDGVEAIDIYGNEKTYYVLNELVDAQRLTSTVIRNVVKDETVENYYKFVDANIIKNNESSRTISIPVNVKMSIPIVSLEYSTATTSNVEDITEADWKKIIDYDMNSSNITFDISTNGNYYFRIKDGKENLFYTETPLNIELANVPKLAVGMTPIYFENGYPVETNANDPNWYNYSKTEKKWANVRLKDGSIYVWIPRFAYKINNTNETIDIKFLRDGTSTTIEGTSLDSSYKVHPAFSSTATSNNGEWSENSFGIWVSKFNANVQTSGDEKFITTTYGKEISKVTSFREAVTLCRNMEKSDRYGFTSLPTGTLRDNLTFPSDNNNFDTHLIKNSEMGALLYLSWSDFGNARNELGSNTTGIIGGDKVGVFDDVEKTSTTGNPYGVYDILKSEGEYVSGGILQSSEVSNISEIAKYFTSYNSNSSSNTIIRRWYV